MAEIWTYTPYDMREWKALHSKGDALGILKLERAQYVWRDPYPHITQAAWKAMDAMTEATYGNQALEDTRAKGLAHQQRLQAMADQLDKEIAACQMP